MTLFEWSTKALENIYLWKDEIEIYNKKVNATITRNVEKERKLSISLINCASPDDLYDCARQYCPIGTVIEPIENNDWTSLYNDKTKMVFAELTKSLIDERNGKSAKILLEILSRRLETWKENKKTATVSTDGTATHITFEIG